VAVVFQNRHTVLLFRHPEVTYVLKQKVDPEEPADATRTKKLMKEFQAHLSTWSATGLHQAKARLPGIKKVEQQLKHLQSPPQGVEALVKEFPQEFQIMLKGFSKTTFNWFTCPKGNNTEKIRIRFANHLLEEATHHVKIRANMLNLYPELYSIRLEILQLIHATSGLASFECWTTFIPASWSEEPQSVEFQEHMVTENTLLLAKCKAREKLDKAFNTLVQTLAQEGLCGVLKEDSEEHKLNSYALHPSLGRALSRLYKVSFLL
jgi:hypothetical protein